MSFHHDLRRVAYVVLAGTVFSGATPTAVDAAMAPEYERLRLFGLVMSAGNGAAAMLGPHGPINRIEHMEDGTFRFRAGQCFVPATLEALSPGETPPQPGTPTDYRVSLGAVRCE